MQTNWFVGFAFVLLGIAGMLLTLIGLFQPSLVTFLAGAACLAVTVWFFGTKYEPGW